MFFGLVLSKLGFHKRPQQPSLQHQHQHQRQRHQTMDVFFHSSLGVTNTTTESPIKEAGLDIDQTVLEAIPVSSSSLDGGWFGKIGLTLILLFGTFGNVMTVIILRRLRSGWSAMNVYLTALALSDTAMLYSVALPMWSRKVLDYDVHAIHVVICKLFIWAMNTVAALSAWLLVALTAQRAASVVWPHRVNVICTRHKSVVTIVVISTMCSLLYSHTLYGFDLVESGNGTSWKCTFGSTDYQVFFASIWVIADLFIYSVFPCVFLIASNVVLGWKVTVAMKEARANFSAGSECQKDSRQKKASSVTVTIIIVSVAFVVVTIPLQTYNTLFYGYASDFGYFLYDVFFVFALTNFGWNFYLYCLTGSKFREEFKILFRCHVPVASSAEPVCVTDESRLESEVAIRASKKIVTETNDDF